MSLLHSLISDSPLARRTSTSSWAAEAWPASTAMRRHDVIVDGNSMLEVAAAIGTPCTRTSAAASTSHGSDPFASVVVTRVLATDEQGDGLIGIWVDASLDQCRSIIGEARLVGRRSTAGLRSARVRPAGTEAGTARLPADVKPGDLLVVPCRGGTALADVRGRDLGRAAGSSHPDDDPLPHCGR